MAGVKRFAPVAATAAERSAALPGDQIVARPDVVMDRGFWLPAPPEAVWPWLVQLGKARGGWYLPAAAERWLAPRRRALRRVDPRLQGLMAGDVIPDWGGRDATFEVVILDPQAALVHRSTRGSMQVSWAITLTPAAPGATRLHLRLRLGPVRRRWLAVTGGELIDWLTIAGLAAGLRERLAPGGPARRPGQG
jgi:hypothetical protein